jgi:hypothetical protein
MPKWRENPSALARQQDQARKALEYARAVQGWPAPTMTEDEMLDLINRDGGFPVRILLDGQVYDVRRAA